MRLNLLYQESALVTWQELIAAPGATEMLPFNNKWKVYC